ncbi:MAG: bifunctional pyr operon transcriptional regulator/uracil phosphoribosyltransferase PyrR [Deltaproteobacteria bacterium]|nr:bifunctional pyr operon transcriptional regulator/uracil phosphoribosyltransferase PyrR [Deltaproteobacteria bacterium]MBW2415899.1 bifunctional pyr operon transcriptional regulator/uracil phosphoribosyltransferase PyrR [Deltaproteobacteria bacterium]
MKSDQTAASGSDESAPDTSRPDPDATGRVVLDGAGIQRAVARISHEILERNGDPETIAIVGIESGGVPISEMIGGRVREISGAPVLLGSLDVTLYRDDVIGRGKRPVPHRTRMPFSVRGLRVVLVDDVVFTGRTIRAAMDAVIDFGRPEGIQVAALVDRGHRELPIQVDFVGKNIPTSRAESVVFRPSAGGDYEVVLQ